MRLVSVSPSRRTLSAASRNSGSTRREGKDEDFMGFHGVRCKCDAISYRLDLHAGESRHGTDRIAGHPWPTAWQRPRGHRLGTISGALAHHAIHDYYSY